MKIKEQFYRTNLRPQFSIFRNRIIGNKIGRISTKIRTSFVVEFINDWVHYFLLR